MRSRSRRWYSDHFPSDSSPRWGHTSLISSKNVCRHFNKDTLHNVLKINFIRVIFCVCAGVCWLVWIVLVSKKHFSINIFLTITRIFENIYFFLPKSFFSPKLSLYLFFYILKRLANNLIFIKVKLKNTSMIYDSHFC